MKNLLIILLILLSIVRESNGQGITFAANKGQWNDSVLYKASLPGGALFVTPAGPVYAFAAQDDLDRIHEQAISQNVDPEGIVRHHAYRFTFLNGRVSANIIPSSKLNYYENFFLGNDTSKWAHEVPHFRHLVQSEVFPNIDLVYKAEGLDFKYDLIVKPGGKVSDIQLQLEGASAQIDTKGNLVITTSVNTVVEEAPLVFQIKQGDTLFIPARYKFEKGVLSFDLAKYDKKLPLIIDPSLAFATYSGATTSNFYSYTSTYDYDGNTIIGALAYGPGWPTQMGAYSNSFSGGTDAAIMKLTSDGTQRLFATYLGGSSVDAPQSLIASDINDIYIVGTTMSTNFPLTAGAYQTTFGGGVDIFVARINSLGTQLSASSYLGGNGGDGQNVIVSAVNNANKSPSVAAYNAHDRSIWFVSTTMSLNFPITSNAMSNTYTPIAAVLVQMDSTLSQLMYSSYFNFNGDVFFNDIKVSAHNAIYLAGLTGATDAATVGAFRSTFQGGDKDGIVVKFNPNTKTISKASYLGTNANDNAMKLALTADGSSIYIAGNTEGNYLTTANTLQVPSAKNYIQQLDSNLTTSIAAASFGSTDPLLISDITIHPCAGVGIAGMKYNNSFPITPDAYAQSGEFWMGNISSDLTSLNYGTYYGYNGHTHTGTFRFDNHGNIHHSVCDVAGNFVTSPNAWSPTKLTSGFDMISFRFNVLDVDLSLDFELQNIADTSSCAPAAIEFQNNSQNYDTYTWYFGDGDSSTAFAPSHTYTVPGLYKVVLVGTNELCGEVAKDSLFIRVKEKAVIRPFVTDSIRCWNPASITFSLDSVQLAHLLPYYQIHWLPQQALLGPDGGITAQMNHQAANTQIDIFFQALPHQEYCLSDTMASIHLLYYDSLQLSLSPINSTICKGDSVLLKAAGAQGYDWHPLEQLRLVDDSTAIVSPEASSGYLVTMWDENGCGYYKMATVNILPVDEVDAGPDIVSRVGEEVVLKGSSNAAHFYWEHQQQSYFANVLRPSLVVSEDATYILVAQNENGCMSRDTMDIFVSDVGMANAFTPNGDGLNDVFYPIPMNSKAEMIHFGVYNRYGQCVFYTRKLNEGWNGFFQNKQCDAAVYFYYVEYKIGEKHYKIKGDVTLIR
jgi:gliding motility-associated-like protein